MQLYVSWTRQGLAHVTHEHFYRMLLKREFYSNLTILFIYWFNNHFDESQIRYAFSKLNDPVVLCNYSAQSQVSGNDKVDV